MKITSMQVQVRNSDRVSVSVDGAYAFSLSVHQVAELGIKVGQDLTDAILDELRGESAFGKLYQRALEYVLLRPRSVREVSGYLYRKTQTRPVRSRATGEVKMVDGVSSVLTDRVQQLLIDKGYVDDEKFAEFWVRHRFVAKGVSARKLRSELMAKGVAPSTIEAALRESNRTDEGELQKIIEKKRRRYSDDQKFMQYLVRQGFSYDNVKAALSEDAR